MAGNNLLVRLVMDAAGYLRTVDTAVASNTKLDESIAGVGETAQISATKSVNASLRATKALETQIAGWRELAASATASAETQERASLLAERGQARLNSQLGAGAIATARVGDAAAKTGERDLGKLTRGVLAGSGAASSLGRSLAFASTGFIAVAGGATLLASSIKASISLAQTQRQVEAQLKTGGKSWNTYGAQIEAADGKLSHISGFTNQELLQGFGFLVRGNNNVSESLKLEGVAADVARARNISLASASIALAKAQGGSLTALRRLGIIVPKNATTTEALAFVTQKFAGQAAAGATVSDHFHASLVNTEETIGNALLPTFTRLTTELSDWLDKMTQSGRLQRDVDDGLKLIGVGATVVKDAFKAVDTVTGGLNNTLRILFTVWLGREAIKAIVGVERLAASWGLVASSATAAAAAEQRAVAAGGEAGAAGAAGGAGSAAGGLGIGAFLGATARRLLGRGTTGVTTRVGLATGDSALAAEGAGAIGLSATGVGALAVASVIAAGALDSLAKSGAKAAGAPSQISKGIDVFTGVLTGGLAGDPRFGILGQALHGFPGFSGPRQPVSPPPAYLTHLQRSGGIPGFLRIPGLTSQAASPQGAGPFGGATPISVYAAYSQTISEQLAGARAALTKTTKDDVANARAVIARIKRLIDQGHLSGASLIQGLQDEASQQSVLDNARQAAAQQAAAIAAAKKAAASSYSTPIDLQLAEARSQLTSSTTDDVAVEKRILAAAQAAIASGKKNKQGQLAALQVELQAKQAIQAASSQSSTTFTQPLKLQLALAKAQALGTDQGPILLREKAALEKALKAAHGNIQKQIDIYNQIAAINQQLGSQADVAFGNYKQASLAAETAGLGLSHAQRKLLEARLSQRGPGGTTPGSGTGAGGYIIGPDGRPIQVHRHRPPDQGRGSGRGGGGERRLQATFNIRIELDGKDITRSVTIHQQRTRDRNPSQRRGPHAGKTTA